MTSTSRKPTMLPGIKATIDQHLKEGVIPGYLLRIAVPILRQARLVEWARHGSPLPRALVEKPTVTLVSAASQ